VAKYFSQWHGTTAYSQVHAFRVIQPLQLLRIENRAHLEFAIQDLGYDLNQCLGGEDNYEGLLHLFTKTQSDGWIIPNNYPDGDDICLATLHKITNYQIPIPTSPDSPEIQTLKLWSNMPTELEKLLEIGLGPISNEKINALKEIERKYPTFNPFVPRWLEI